jgi:hypothetical protein
MGFVYILAGFLVLILVAARVRLARHRGVSRDAFVKESAADDIPTGISGAVFDYYRSLSSAKEFSVAPDDSFRKVFREVDEDVNDDAVELVRILKMELPMESILGEWVTPLETLRDMVLWLNWIRQQQDEQSAWENALRRRRMRTEGRIPSTA